MQEFSSGFGLDGEAGREQSAERPAGRPCSPPVHASRQRVRGPPFHKENSGPAMQRDPLTAHGQTARGHLTSNPKVMPTPHQPATSPHHQGHVMRLLWVSLSPFARLGRLDIWRDHRGSRQWCESGWGPYRAALTGQEPYSALPSCVPWAVTSPLCASVVPSVRWECNVFHFFIPVM